MRYLIVALFACIGISFQVFSQVVTPFTVRKTLTQKGGILFLSNGSSRANPANIVQNQIPPSGTAYNNSFTNTYIDIDTDASTWMSSSDQLNLPACSEISWAGLYWGADCSLGDENYATRNSVKLKVDNGSYMDLIADEMQDNTVGYKTYHCFKDITSILQANSLTSNYTVANMAGDVNGTNLFGGWTIVVMYKNNTMTMRNLTVFNGLANVSSAAPVVDIPISGFQTPLSGPVTFELGLVLYDGDRSLTGDQLMFKGASAFVNISDAIHNPTDVFNSTLSRNGVLTPLRNPSYNNTLGYDANIFSPNNTAKNYIGNNAVSAVIRQTTGGEFFLTQVVTSAIDVYEPDLRAAVRVKNITHPNAALAESGDILEYTVTGLNIGSDPSINTYISDTIEGNAFYVPGSLSIVSGPNAGPLSDALGDDQGEYLSSSKTIKVRMGTGANSFLGGLVINSPSGADSTQIRFRTQVTSDCVYLSCDGTINNKAFIIGTGNVSGNTFSNASNPGVFDSNGCAISGTTATPIDVSGCGPIAASANAPICQGGSINFTASYSPAATYVWTGPNGFLSNINNPTINNVQAVNAGTYIANIYITGTPCHFVYPFVADISIANAGNDMNGISTCGLTQVTLSGNNPTGTTGVWTIISGSGGSFGTGNTSTSTNPNAVFNGVSGNTYVLRWALTSMGCSPTTDDVTVTFLQAPTTATLTGVSATCNNQLNAVITGGVSPYTLSINNGVGTVSNYISGTNISVSPSATTTYTLSTVTGANGCQLTLTSSNTATITISSSVSGGVIAPVVALSFTSGNSGEKFPTANSVSSSGNNSNASWSNPENAYTDNGSAAIATGNKDETKFLYLRNFGFSIPSNAVIDGVIVKIDKKRENLSGKNVNDNKITLVATTTTLGNNKAVTSTNWPTDYTVSTYGSSTDMWGNTTSALTPSVVNGSNFGLGIAAKLSSSSSIAYIDYASITIHYHIGNNSYCDTESAVSFNITGATGATSYNWVPPTGATITAGQGTATATIDFNGAGQSGNYTIMCTPSNACGAGTPVTLSIPITDCTNPTPLCVSGNVYWDYNGNNIVDGTGIGMINSTQLYVTVARTSNTTTSFITTPVNSNGTWKACHSSITSNRGLRVTLNTSNYTNGTTQSSTTVTLPTGVSINGEINNDLGNTLTGLGTSGTGTDGTINGQLNFTTVDPMSNTETNLNFGLKISTPPVANNNAVTTNEDVAVSVNVATNDTDVDGTVSASSVDLNTTTSGTQTSFTQAGIGTFTVNTSGVVTFTPVANYNGTTTITYTIKDNDALVSNSANITVTVVPVNDPPVATASSVTTFENVTYEFLVSNFNYTDLESDLMQSITIASLPALGNLMLNGVAVTVGQTIPVSQLTALSYVPPTNESGTPYTTFNFKANDAALGVVAGVMTINVTNVNVAPTAVNDMATTDQGAPVSFNILTNDICQDGTIVPSTVDLDPNTAGQQTTALLPGQGTFSVNTSGQVTFTPVSSFYGTTMPITYTVSSSLSLVSNSATISVTVIPFGSPVAVDDAATTPKNVSVVFSVTNNDTDDIAIDPSRVDFEPTISGIQQAKYVAGKGQFSADMLGNVTFTPDFNYSGVVAITYTVKDNANLVSNVANITVTVTWVNSPPIAVDDILETDEDTPVSANLLTNDYDLDVAYGNSGIINVASVDLDPLLNGIQTTRTITGEGSYAVTNTGVLTFTPALNYNGFATPIGYVIKDLTGALSDSATIYITVNAKNDAPVAVNDTLYVSETTATNTGSITITLNDTDIDGNIDVASVDLNPNISGIQTTFTVSNEGTYTADANGVVTFSYSFITPVGTLTPVAYTVLDNSGLASNNGLLQVIVLSQSLPISANDDFTILEDTPDSFDVTANDVDDYGTNPGIDPASVDLDPNTTGQQLTSTLTGQGTFSVNTLGEITFTPVLNYYGSASINYIVKDLDNNISNVSTITVVVSPVNDQPTFTAGSNQTVCANAGAQLVDYWATNLSAGPANEATQTLSFVVTNNNNALFGDQPAIDNNGNLTYSTATNQSGSSTITVQLQDNGGTANGGVDLSTSQTFTITVTMSPVAGTLAGNQAICVGSTTSFTSSATGGTWSSSSTATATVNSSGLVTGAGAGTATITYTVAGTGGCTNATATRTVTVTALPSTPSASVTTQPTCSVQTGTITFTSQAGVEYSINGTNFQASKIFSGLAPGSYTPVVRATSNNSCTTSGSSVTVNAVPSAPTTPAASVTVQPTCAVSTGTIVFTTQAGVEYSIDGTNYQASATFTGVAAGTYTPKVRSTSDNTCTATGTAVTVNAAPSAPTTPAASVTVQPTCAVTTGTIVFTTQAGVEYSINGTNYQASATFPGVAAGTYTPKVRSTSDNTCTATGTAVTVNAAPGAPTTPAASVTVQPTCAVSTGTIVFTTQAGVEYSINGTNYQASATFTGVAAGTYTPKVRSTSDNTCTATGTAVTVNAAPSAPVAGTLYGTQELCAGSTTSFTSSEPGGTWSSDLTNVATIDANGLITGISSGTATITYTVAGSGSCADATATRTITVTAISAGTISGTTAICANGSSTLTSSVTGGSWTSATPAVATIAASTGAVAGVSAGTSLMTYTITGTGGCANVSTTATVTVTAVPTAGTISGTTAICANGSSTLTSSVTGGSWTSATPAVATIDASTGDVTGLTAGTSIMTYTVTGTGGCANVSTTATVTVTAVPSAGTISGTTAICANGSSTLTSTVTGGSWTSATPAVATIAASTGAVAGVSAGTSLMTYTITGTGGCANVSTTATVTVTAVPTAGTISGTTAICANGSSTLTSSVTGGSWTSATPAVATIAASTGAVTGVAAGTSVMTYTVTGTGGCANVSTTATVAVTAFPSIPTAIVTQPTCATPTGSININIISGVQYAINGGPYQTSNVFLNLSAGSYPISVCSNANNACATTGNAVVINAALGTPTIPVASVTVIPTCAAPTGTIVLSAPLGAFDYSLNGISYQSGTSFSGLAPGTYNLTARRTADLTCVSTALSLTINPVTALPTTPSAVATQPTCATPTGTINFNTQAGVQYAINGVNYVSGNSFSNLAPGNYPISVRANNDATCVTNGAVIAIVAAAGAPTAPTATAAVQPTCAAPTGTLTITAPLGAFEYSINGGSYQTATSFSGLIPGTYNVNTRRTTDLTCISSTTSVTINAVPSLPALPTANVTQPTCAVATGTIAFVPQTGVQYALNGGSYQAGATFAALTPGTYFLYLRNSADASCVSVGNLVLVNAVPSVPSAPSVSSITQPVCGTTTGAFTIGSPIGNYTYAINGTSYQANTSFSALPPGTYNCTARSTTDLTCISLATSVTIAPVPNCIPIATNDLASTNEDTPVSFNLTNNDTDNDGTINAATVDLNPSLSGIQTTFTNTQGTWAVTAGVMTFTPNANFTGTASITYTVNDNIGATSNAANITVNVVPVNDAPIANNDSASTAEDAQVSLNITNNDSDTDGTINVNTIDLDPTTAGIQNTFVNAQGTWSVTGGIVTFTPLANFNGSAAIDYTVNDNSGEVSNTATITINVPPVNDAPVANNDSATTNEDTPVAFDISANDTDVDGTINSNTIDLNPIITGIQSNISTAQGAWAATAGVLTFTPAANFTGTASSNYTVKDNSGLLSNVAVITINVLPLNDAPVANNDVASTNEDAPVSLNLTNNDNDVDGTIDANTVDLDPTTPGIQTTVTNGQGTWTVINGVLTFTPAANFNGSASINYTVNDNLGTTSNVATISITVVSVNDLPVANNDFATTNEDTPVSFNITNNDTDVDGSINANTVDLNPTVAGIQTAFVNAQGTWTVTAGVLTFTPLANFNGTASIVYTVKDNSGAISNTATITVNVVPVNDLPVANNDAATTNEDTQVTLNITNNDTDTDGTINTSTIDLDPSTPGIQTTFTNGQGTWTVANGNLTFTPALNFNGAASINYTVNDNNGGTSNIASIAINVTAVNDAPVANNDVASTNENTPVIFNITNNDFDVDGFINPSSVDLNPNIIGAQTSFNNPQGAWNLIAGQVSYSPALNFNGTASITYTVNDNSGAISNSATITVTVLSVNNPPVANNDFTSTIEDTPVSLNIINNDTDSDGTINFNTVDLNLSTAGIQTTVNTAQGSASVAAGVLTFTPISNFNGAASIPYRVNDNGGATSNVGMITIQVTPVNDAPVLDNELLIINYNGSQTGDLTNVGDFDPDGTNLLANTIPLVGPQNGTITIAQDGTFNYQANANFVGTDLVVVQVCDQGSPLPFLCATDTIFITVNACSLLDANQDCDLDGLTNGQETALGSDPTNPDTDGDGVLDGTEVADGTNPLNPCSLVFASQTLAPSTAWNNLDCDNDGLSNGAEIAAGTDLSNPDTDGDGVLDGTEVTDGTNPLNPCSLVIASQTLAPSTAWNNLDCDNDGLSNGAEIATGTDPANPDTDGDGVLDGKEVADGTNPINPCSFVFASQTVTPSTAWNNLDCDSDGLSNGGETTAGTDPTNPDTDGDGVLDGTEVTDGTNPLDPCSFLFANQTVTPSVGWNNLDCDNDGLTNGQEAASGTNPNNPDTDGDGVTDGDEFNDGTNPIDPCEYILSSQTVTPSPQWAALDCDNDGLSNGQESGNGSDPTDPCDPLVSGSNCNVEIIVPEAFSPDGDGTNETFIIEGLQYFDENEIIIFNRWGSEVFRMSPYDNTWDGTSQNPLNVGGAALPTGTYFYILDTKTEKYGVIKGYIYLKR